MQREGPRCPQMEDTDASRLDSDTLVRRKLPPWCIQDHETSHRTPLGRVRPGSVGPGSAGPHASWAKRTLEAGRPAHGGAERAHPLSEPTVRGDDRDERTFTRPGCHLLHDAVVSRVAPPPARPSHLDTIVAPLRQVGERRPFIDDQDISLATVAGAAPAPATLAPASLAPAAPPHEIGQPTVQPPLGTRAVTPPAVGAGTDHVHRIDHDNRARCDGQALRATRRAEAWSRGRTTSWSTLTCAGRATTHDTHSATSSALSGVIPS